MSKFVDIGGCPVPTGDDFDLAVEYVVKRLGVNPTTVYRGDEPEALRIMHANGKHSQRELYEAALAGQGARWGIRGIPNPPGISTHECRSDGTAFPGPRGRKLPDYQCGMDWPDSSVPSVKVKFNELGMGCFSPYPSSLNERQHVCNRRAPKFTVEKMLYVRPLRPGEKRPSAKSVQVYMKRGDLWTGRIAKRVGTYGPELVQAVKRFQRANGLTPDGVVGVATFAKMKREYGWRRFLPKRKKAK